MDSVYALYDDVLMGNKATCGKELFESTVNGKKEYNPADEEIVLKLVRYAFTYYRNWEPEQFRCNLTAHELKRMKLDSIVKQRIKFPVELDPMDNMQYLVHRLFPERYSYNEKQAIETYYDRVLDREVKRFKKGFFTEEKGAYRAGICFQRMLQMIGPFQNIHEVYDLFASTEGRKVLSNYKLSSAARDLYEFPIDFLHFSLPPADRDELYYQKLRFNEVNCRQKKSMRKQGTFIA